MEARRAKEIKTNNNIKKRVNQYVLLGGFNLRSKDFIKASSSCYSAKLYMGLYAMYAVNNEFY